MILIESCAAVAVVREMMYFSFYSDVPLRMEL
jgi:hypothetical protein